MQSESTISARFSPGPWWGFNGVDDLELSDGVLTRRHVHIFGGRRSTYFKIGAIGFLLQEIRAGRRNRQDKWLRMTISIGGRKQIFTGHIEDGKPFATALSRMTTPS